MLYMIPAGHTRDGGRRALTSDDEKASGTGAPPTLNFGRFRVFLFRRSPKNINADRDGRKRQLPFSAHERMRGIRSAYTRGRCYRREWKRIS